MLGFALADNEDEQISWRNHSRPINRRLQGLRCHLFRLIYESSNSAFYARKRLMFLDRIVAQTRLDLEQRKLERPLEEMKRLAMAQPPARDLLEAIRPGGSKPQVRLIAEVKRASPSKGLLAPH